MRKLTTNGILNFKTMEKSVLNKSKLKLVAAITEAIKVFDDETNKLVIIEKIEVNIEKVSYQDLEVENNIKVVISARL